MCSKPMPLYQQLLCFLPCHLTTLLFSFGLFMSIQVYFIGLKNSLVALRIEARVGSHMCKACAQWEGIFKLI